MILAIPPLIFEAGAAFRMCLPAICAVCVTGFAPFLRATTLSSRSVRRALIRCALTLIIALPALLFGDALMRGAATALKPGNPLYWFFGGLLIWIVPITFLFRVTGVSRFMLRRATDPDEGLSERMRQTQDYPGHPLKLE